jgi:hypothetical protein
LARGRGDHRFRSVGELELKGLPDPVPTDEVQWEPAPVDAARALPPVLVSGNDFAIAGRDRELAALQEAWKASSTGAGRLVLLGGEPGIGKTRLVRELAVRVLGEGGLVLAGRSDDGFATPYGPFAEALLWSATLDPDAELGEYPTELVRIAPELARLVPKLSTVDVARSDGDAMLTIKTIRPWLRATAADNQRCSSRRSALGRSPAGAARPVRSRAGPGSVLGTYRDTELDRRHPRWRPRRSAAGRVRHPSRSCGSTRRGQALPDGAAGRARRPHRGWRPRCGPRRPATRSSSAGPPPPVETGIIVQRRQQSATARVVIFGIPDGIRVVGVASVIGLEFDVPILAASAGRSDDEILDALDEAQRSALVSDVVGETWRFAHAIVRDTLRSEIPNTRRIRMHRTIATAIETQANSKTDGRHLARLPLGRGRDLR